MSRNGDADTPAPEVGPCKEPEKVTALNNLARIAANAVMLGDQYLKGLRRVAEEICQYGTFPHNNAAIAEALRKRGQVLVREGQAHIDAAEVFEAKGTL